MAGFLRGLFGSSANHFKDGGQYQARMPDGSTSTMQRAPQWDPAADEAARAEKQRKWAVIGATLQDVGAGLSGRQGGSLERVQTGYRARAAQDKNEAELDRIKAMAAELYPDDEKARFLFSVAPEKFVEQQLDERAEARKPKSPVMVNTRLGPRLYHPDTGEYTHLEDIKERLPPGYRYAEDGSTEIDPTYVQGQGALADARAAATARHRAPPRGRSSVGAPSGPRRSPWED